MGTKKSLGAVWLSKSGKAFTGGFDREVIGELPDAWKGKRLLVFRNDDKTNDRQPDLKIYLVDDERPVDQAQGRAAPPALSIVRPPRGDDGLPF